MIKNYLLTSLRNLQKHIGYSAINIFGLGLGLAITMLLALWVKHEISFDKFHAESDNLYRVSVEMSFGGKKANLSVSPTALLPALQTNFEDVKNGVRIYNPSSYSPYIVKKGDNFFQEDHFYFADSSFFKVFSYQLIKGNPDKALSEPRSVVLTKSMVKKYFGDEEAIGKELLINGQNNYIVTGVVEDAPDNSYLRFDFIGSFSTLRQAAEEGQWFPANYQTFVTVNPHADLPVIESKTNELVANALANQLPGPDDYVKYNWTNVEDIYLRSQALSEMEPVGNIQYVYIFSGIALLVLIIACINYINLATARASYRAKEVGVRKVVGANKSQLIIQFIGESIIVTILSFVFAFILIQFLLPFFNSLTGKELNHFMFLEPDFLLGSLAVLILIAIGSGAYPALAITSFRPVSILKGNFRTSAKGIWLRKSLVVFQFCVSIVLIIGTVAIVRQLEYVQGKKLGYEKENTIVIPLDKKTDQVYNALKTEFLRTGKVKFIGRSTDTPVEIKGGYTLTLSESNDPGMSVVATAADEDFIPALDMEIVAGRNYVPGDFQKLRSDTIFSFIVNETILKELFLTNEEAIGKQLDLNGRKGEIVGVVRDFHFASLHRAIGPLVIFNGENEYFYMIAKLNSGNITETLDNLRQVSNQIVPHRPFTYEFLDQQYTTLYSSEERMGTLFGIFATLAIIIACLGLLGLVSFSATQKTKEIGIRKVMGATVSNIVLLITNEYTKLIVLSTLFGVPLALYIVNLMLSNFAYRTNLGVMSILVAVVACILIAFGTASYQAIKAAFINPAETLRNE